ncbi:SUKH-4 family immunity protein [Streptomyces sp. NPDC017993]|uniref:SUKH-4 family immunity protein n=1 Tax=Streptomyces sp. NPDC017993 TaxID=3365027 RepID=UPI00379C0ACD
MFDRDQAGSGASGQEITSLVVTWWQNWRPGDNWANLVDPSGSDGAAFLGEVHRRIEGSVLLDAAGRTAEEVHAEVLQRLGIDLSPGNRWDWRHGLKQLGQNRLVLIANAHRAGCTRGSSEPDRVLSTTIGDLEGGTVGVLVHLTPERLPRLAKVAFRLLSPVTTEVDWPIPVRALSLARPRIVPMRVWAELTNALGGERVSETVLHSVLEDFSPHLLSGEHGVAFADESLAERLRRGMTEDEICRVDRHMAEWLKRSCLEFRHPEGWAESGPEGRYAATGLVMHAAQADFVESVSTEGSGRRGLFEDLLQNGGMMANVPQTALLDAARCAYIGDVPGNAAAGAAVQLWSYGVVPPRQAEWASWLHLIATARGDRAFADAVADSGVRLPWKAKWTRWRPPGGYHWSYLVPGPVDGLAEVRWQGRPAVAGLYTWSSRADIWDAATGEHLAGPWKEEIPEECRPDLAWPSGQGEGRPGPETVADFEDAMSDEDAVHDLFLDSPPLHLDNQVIFGGPGGLFAIEPADADTFSGLNFPGFQPFSGSYAFTTAVTPAATPPPSPADLAELYGAQSIHKFSAGMIPEGLTDEPMRRTLTEFGLPEMSDEDGLGIYPHGDHRMRIFDEVPWPSDVAPVEESGPFFQIGFWMGGALVIDAPTGHVLRIPSEPGEEHLAGLPAAHSLENFLTMVALWITGLLLKGLVEGDDEANLLPDHVLAAHRRIDPEGAEAPAWAYAFHNP